MNPIPRRTFLASLAALPSLAGRAAATSVPPRIGINTSSFGPLRHASDPAERIACDDIPRVLREELDLTIIDLESVTFGPPDPAAAARFRALAEKAGCTIINLKVNAHDLPFDSEDRPAREPALATYRKWIEVAAALGARSVRPYPARTRPRLETLVESYLTLADHADRHGLTVLIENYLWLESEPQIIPEIVRRTGGRIRALVDTGNWADAATRRAGLAAAFPHAMTCDFKFRDLAPDGTHAAYDLCEAFLIGRAAGYRGPWCFEHTHRSRRALIRELLFMKSQLESWAAA